MLGQPLGHAGLQGVIDEKALRDHRTDLADIGVDPGVGNLGKGGGRVQRWKLIEAAGHLCNRLHGVDVVLTIRQVGAVRAGVADCGHEVSRELVLHIQAVLLHVGPRRMLRGVTIAEGQRRQQRVGLVWEGAVQPSCDAAGLEERRGEDGQPLEQVVERQRIIDAIGAVDHRLVVGEG